MIKLLATICLAVTAHAASPPLQLKWAELNAAVRNRHLSVIHKDGSITKGVANRVEGSVLIVISEKKRSEVSVPRETISSLVVTKNHVRGRILGTTLGGLVGIVGGAIVVLHGSGQSLVFPNYDRHRNRPEQVAGYGLMMGLPLGGYFLGSSLDRHDVTIVISPQ